ncbi:hypothetical protein NKR23_g6036 [Pleurostoma richardsiae]|uniref:Cellobiose dehydrogenase-like cytochrome domain-containing protein n=1 Tax=Pleurostoma richardsiae TaxID=41990 RepID=A0AA38VSW6_9PEZI|nr:hypothetical protein NKR23_g6036 [Pleurostoma richardsiae]
MRFLSVNPVFLTVAASTATAQNLSIAAWADASSGIAYKLAIPDVSSAPFPLLMSIVAPVDVTWAAFATGACMLRSPLVVAWPSGTNVIVTARWATQYHPPLPYANTTLITYSTSSVNATHWTASFLCAKGCSNWYGGSIDPKNSNATFGYAASNRPVAVPASTNSSIPYHNIAKGHFDIDLTRAKNAIATFQAASKGVGPIW